MSGRQTEMQADSETSRQASMHKAGIVRVKNLYLKIDLGCDMRSARFKCI